jgi:glycosyltransferase involved in cell wall biosynthesis
MPVDLTAAICTWNRSGMLRRTLESVSALSPPTGVEWEVVVVDNNSTDDTAAVLREFTDRLPLRAVLEPTQGTVVARNRAVREARGALVVWTDDDVQLDPGWLAAYAEAARLHPEAGFFGGPIDPWFEGDPPRWLEASIPKIWDAFAVVADVTDTPILPSHRRIPLNANLAVRRDLHDRYPYDPKLGHRADRPMGGEETAMLRAMLADGITGRWVPGARVRHYIPRARQTPEFVRRYYGGLGRALARRGQKRADPSLLGRPLWLWRQALRYELRYRVRHLLGAGDGWVEDLRWAALSWGQIAGHGEGDTA